MGRSWLYPLGTVAAALLAGLAFCMPDLLAGRKLTVAERLLESHPDSASAILSTVNPDRLHFLPVRSRHTLLSVLADGSVARTAQLDSALHDAHAFYLRHGNALRKTQSWYCLGSTQLENGAYREAILSFLNAEREARQDKHDLYQARSLRGVAESFAGSWMDSTAAYYHHASAEAFKRAGYPRHAAYAYLSEALSLSRCGKGDEPVFSELESYASDIGDSILYGCAELVRATFLMNRPETDYPEALRSFQHAEGIVPGIMDAEVFADMALAFQQTGNPAEADRYLARAKASLTEESDRSAVLHREAGILSERHAQEQAFALMDSALTLQKALYQDKLENSVAVAQRDYLFASRAQVRDTLARRTVLWILSLLIIALGCVALYLQRKRRMVEQEALLSDLAFFKQDLERATRSEDRLHRIIGGMLDKERYLINELSDAFMSGRLSDPKQTERELEKHVQHLASDGTVISVLTQAVNLQENRIMDRLQEQVPDLSPDELAFCALLAAGLSTGSIRILTAESRSNIYTKKSRIKARILASDAADKEDFLRHFGF